MIPSLEKLPARPQDRIPAAEVLSRIAPRVRAKARKDLLVYVHVPFCTSKCHFCDWVSAIPVKDLIAERDVRRGYVRGVCEQIRWYGPRLMELGYQPKQIYWGGGTPSRLEVDELEEVIAALKAAFDLSKLELHSLEGSPETFTPAKLKALRAAGVGRISMGVQSMDDEQLRQAARSHDSRRVAAAAQEIRAAGFEDYNFDIIAGFPGEKREVFETSLRKAVGLKPSHFSLYPFRSNSTTVMARQVGEGHSRGLSREEMFQTYFDGKRILRESGYREYICGYFVTEPRFEFKGERYYFELEGDYVGFGPGATSVLGHHYLENTIPRASGNGGDLARYVQDPASVDQCELHTTPDQPYRVMTPLADAVMTARGIDYARFEDLYGCSFQEMKKNPVIESLIRFYGFCGAKLVDTGDRLYVTEETRDIARLSCTIERNNLEQLAIKAAKGAAPEITPGAAMLQDALS